MFLKKFFLKLGFNPPFSSAKFSLRHFIFAQMNGCHIFKVETQNRITEVESRTQGSRPRPRPRTQKKIRGQGQGQPFRGQNLSRPRTGMLEAKDQGHKAQVLSKKKKKRSSQKFFWRSPKKKKKRSSQNFSSDLHEKNAFQKIFQPLHKILTFRKIVLSSSRGQANFRGLEASRPRPRPRTSKSVLEDVLEAKDVLEDSTSAELLENRIFC